MADPSTNTGKGPLGQVLARPVPVLLCALLAISIVLHWMSVPSPAQSRTTLILTFAGCVLYGANKSIYTGGSGSSDPLFVRYVIAFNSVIFIVVGLVATVVACTSWAAPLLLAGACIMIGGFFGLLFGYPQGAAQRPATSPAAGPANGAASTSQNTVAAVHPPTASQNTNLASDPANGAASTSQNTGAVTTPTASQNTNLVAESAATLGKVIAGFSLAKIQDIHVFFSHLCRVVAPALGQTPEMGYVLAGVLIAYFLSAGFLSGLLLPSYFMSGKFG